MFVLFFVFCFASFAFDCEIVILSLSLVDKELLQVSLPLSFHSSFSLFFKLPRPAAFASLASRRLACAGSLSTSRSSQQPPQAPAPRSAAAAAAASARRPKTICASASASSASGAGNNRVAAAIPNASAPVTDDAVPEAHRGLHASLYGEGDAEDAHGSATKSGSGSGGGDDGPYRARPVRSSSIVFFLSLSFFPTMLHSSLDTLSPNPFRLTFQF